MSLTRTLALLAFSSFVASCVGEAAPEVPVRSEGVYQPYTYSSLEHPRESRGARSDDQWLEVDYEGRKFLFTHRYGYYLSAPNSKLIGWVYEPAFAIVSQPENWRCFICVDVLNINPGRARLVFDEKSGKCASKLVSSSGAVGRDLVSVDLSSGMY